MELPRLSSFHSLQNSGQTQNRPCPETAWHTGPLQVARSFWLTQSGLCTPKVIEMVWITESTTQRNQLTGRRTLQYWNLPCYAEIGRLVSSYQPEKLLQSTFSTQTTKNKTTKNILETNKIALMKSKDAAFVSIQINPTLPLEYTELRPWILQQLSFVVVHEEQDCSHLAFGANTPGRWVGRILVKKFLPENTTNWSQDNEDETGTAWSHVVTVSFKACYLWTLIAPLLVLLDTLTWLNTSVCTWLHWTFW